MYENLNIFVMFEHRFDNPIKYKETGKLFMKTKKRVLNN